MNHDCKLVCLLPPPSSVMLSLELTCVSCFVVVLDGRSAGKLRVKTKLMVASNHYFVLVREGTCNSKVLIHFQVIHIKFAEGFTMI